VKSITVRVRGDRQKETNETFLLDLTGAPNALFARSWAYGMILDDDTR
jgi:hypothetical protein